jgi:hypothetical protein
VEKQTIIWTALPHTSNGPVAEGTLLNLSVHIAPRLWSDDPTVTLLPLSHYPDFLDWPAALSAATFTVEFDGGPAVTAVPVNASLRSDLWQGLFRNDTDVRPYIFQDFRAIPVQSFSATALHETVKGIYQRAAIDPNYGAGLDLPSNDILIADADIRDIARAAQPEEPYVPTDTDRGPVYLDEPGQEEPDEEEKPGGCGQGCLGCLLWPLRLLRQLLVWLGLLPTSSSVTQSNGPAAAPQNSPTTAEAAATTHPVVYHTPPPPSANVTFNQLNNYLQPYNVQSATLPDAQAMESKFDFHEMVANLGDYPLLLRHFGLVVDLQLTLPANLPPLTSTVRVIPTLGLQMATTHYSPRTHYELDDGRFQTRPRPTNPEIANGLLRLHDSNQFAVTQVDLAGSAVKLQNTATNLVALHDLNTRPANSPVETGLPALQTAGIAIIRPDKSSELKAKFNTAYALNAALVAIDQSPVNSASMPGPSPTPTDELYAEDLVRGYRIDVFDDRSNQWHSLCQRLGTYHFPEAPGGPETLSNLEDEGFVQMGATEPIPGTATRVLRVHESLFTWDGWGLCAPRPGLTILDDHTTGEVENSAVTAFKMETGFRAKPGTLPRLRFGYEYRLRARVVDLAGNSAFFPDDPAFGQDVVEKTPLVRYRRFEPVSPPPVMLRAEPVEGESLERLVVRSQVGDQPDAIQATERHLVPPKTAQRMAEQHGHFDGSPAMPNDQAAYDLAGREAGSMTHRLNLVSGDLELLPGVQEVTTPEQTIWLQTNEQFEVAYLPDPFARGVLLLGLPGMASFEEIIDPAVQIVNKIPFSGDWPDPQPLRLKLTGLEANATPAQPQWDAANRVLTVGLPQGETAEVRISSYFDAADLDNTGIWEWIEAANPGNLTALRDQYEAGRTWLHLPFRTLVLVHAVQQPLAIPQITALTDPAAKTLGDTAVALQGSVAIDAKSTGKVDLWARWEDPIDDLSQPIFHSQSQEMHVAEIMAHDPSNDNLAIAAIRHRLGDTRYHHVTYWPIATTRFREYFPPAVTDDPQKLVRPLPAESPLFTAIHIPNSSRPAAPVPLYLLPTFRWDEQEAGNVLTRERRGNGLRVYLERPWFSSGANERLGVVIRPQNIDFDSEAGETLRPYTSQWGRDPLWQAAPTEPLTLAALTGDSRRETGTNLILAELAETTLRVHVAGYEPGYDTDRQLWYANIEMEPGPAYFPFVRLALARFHPLSVVGAEISPIVMADFMQVVPHRRVIYDLNGIPFDTLTMRVEGPSAQIGQLPTTMLVHLEERDDRVPDERDPVGWRPITQPVPMTPLSSQPIEEMAWELSLTLPNPRPQPMRVVVREYERFMADRQTTVQLPRETKAGVEETVGQPGSTFDRPELRLRLVFADALIVP